MLMLYMPKIQEAIIAILDMARDNKLIVILTTLVVLIYLRYFFAVNPTFEMLQTKMEKLDTKLLFEKSPILIEDRLVTPYSVVDTVFKYMYTIKNEWIIDNKLFNPYAQNTHKYMLLYASEPIVIHLVHPNLYNKGKPSNVLQLNLQQSQAIIIPMFWYYSIKGHAFVIELDTIASFIYSKAKA